MSWEHKDYRKNNPKTQSPKHQPTNSEIEATPRKRMSIKFASEDVRDLENPSSIVSSELSLNGFIDQRSWDKIKRIMTRGVDIV